MAATGRELAELHDDSPALPESIEGGDVTSGVAERKLAEVLLSAERAVLFKV